MLPLLRHRALLLAILSIVPLTSLADEIRPSFVMLSDPPISVLPANRVLPPDQLSLWQQVLTRPEVEYQRLAAEAIADAHRQGFPGMDAARPGLLQLLNNADSDPTVVRMAALALIALDTRDSAAALFEASRRSGRDVRAVIEPTLAGWGHQPLRNVWQERLNDPTASRRDLLLAANGLAVLPDPESIPALLKIVHGAERAADLRLACARAAGQIAESGLEADAAQLIQGTSPTLLQRLCSVTLLSRHRSEAAHKQLAQAAVDPEPAVAAAALSHLYGSDPALVLPLVDGALKNRAAEVRDWAARTLIVLPTPERLTTLANLLDDPHPAVRGRVREALFIHARQEAFDAVIRESAMQVLDREGWRGQEQAALLLAALDHKPAALRMVALLESTRPEVMVATAWGLRRLAIPETVLTLFDKAQRQSAEFGMSAPRGTDHQVAHLFEALALLDHQAAIPLMKTFLGMRPGMWDASRGAASWSLGVLLKGKPDDALAASMMVHVRNTAGMPPETPLVRRMCAISIGRMQAKSQLDDVKNYIGPSVDPDEAEYALRWTVKELSGEEIPLPEPATFEQGGWFLTPLPRSAPQ